MADRKQGNRKCLGLTGLVLAVLSFVPYLGLLIIPAALISIAAVVRKSARALAVVGLVATAIRFVGAAVQLPAIPHGTPAFLYRPYATLVLGSYRLPSVPPTATRIRISAGGLFAKSVYMAFDAPEPEVRDFLYRLGNGEIRPVGRVGCRLLTYAQTEEVLQRALAEGQEVDPAKLVYVQVPNWVPWYRPDSIEVGWVASRESPDVPGFMLCYDTGRGRAYFHWHYS